MTTFNCLLCLDDFVSCSFDERVPSFARHTVKLADPKWDFHARLTHSRSHLLLLACFVDPLYSFLHSTSQGIASFAQFICEGSRFMLSAERSVLMNMLTNPFVKNAACDISFQKMRNANKSQRSKIHLCLILMDFLR